MAPFSPSEELGLEVVQMHNQNSQVHVRRQNKRAPAQAPRRPSHTINHTINHTSGIHNSSRRINISISHITMSSRRISTLHIHNPQHTTHHQYTTPRPPPPISVHWVKWSQP
jgi:hypothetical protein